MFISPVRQQSLVSFKGYQEDIQTGEQLIKDINKTLDNSISTSHLYRRFHHLQNLQCQVMADFNPDSPEDTKKLDKIYKLGRYLKDKFIENHEKLERSRDTIIGVLKRYGSEEEYIQANLNIIKKIKIANCGEMAIIGQHLLKQKGIDVDIVRFRILEKGTDDLRYNKGVSDHVILVKNLDEDADINLPKTWGNDAIIIDPWFGIVKRSHLAFNQYKELFDFNPFDEEFNFSFSNYDDKLRFHTRVH
ncbi:MAG: hypothetical protein AB7V50_02635 [Vampirovibrionia bacterium]